VPIGEDSTSASSVLLPGVVAGSVSILLPLVNVETVDVDKMIPENKKHKKDKQRTLMIVVFWSLRARRHLGFHPSREEASPPTLQKRGRILSCAEKAPWFPPLTSRSLPPHTAKDGENSVAL